ncbi:hypothetical protein L7F22_021969 [Adiantum nelumboides]|nr:hypothetical protein [Adiantum nelumboides]
MQQQQTMQQQYQMQERLRQACQTVIDKLQRFEGRDFSKLCRVYEQAMEDNGIQDWEAIDGFHLIVVSALRAQIAEWQDFKKALKEENFLEDSQRVTKQSFMKWIKQKNKGLSTRELLREFEKKYDQLSTTEQRSIRSEQVKLFVQAADACLQKSLEQLLEDALGELGSTSDWKLVADAINLMFFPSCSSFVAAELSRCDLR